MALNSVIPGNITHSLTGTIVAPPTAPGSPAIPANAILDRNGTAIVDRDGNYILTR